MLKIPSGTLLRQQQVWDTGFYVRLLRDLPDFTRVRRLVTQEPTWFVATVDGVDLILL